MIVTLNVCNSFIEQCQEKFIPGKGIRITNFKIAHKPIMIMEKLNVYF
jgi:hypothetical protein